MSFFPAGPGVIGIDEFPYGLAFGSDFEDAPSVVFSDQGVPLGRRWAPEMEGLKK